MEEATSKGGLSRFSVSLSSKQTDRKLLINNDQDGDLPVSGNVDDSPSSPTDVSGVSKVSGINYGSVPKERKSRFRLPKRGKC